MEIHYVLHWGRFPMLRILWWAVFTIGLILPGWVQADLLSSILPGKRTVQVGATATAFATILNTGSTSATSCSIVPATTVDATFLYQTTDPATNALTGMVNSPVDIAAGAAQTFLFAFTPNSAFAQTRISLTFDCTNTAPAPASVVNTFSLGGSATPVPDIIALAATMQNDGIVHLPTTDPDTGVFSVASINVGAPGLIDVTGGTGTALLPVSISVCETNPQTAACINPAVPAGNSTRQYAANETATHSFFVDPSGTVALDPGNNRVFANFQGVGNATQGATSVAVKTNTSTNEAAGPANLTNKLIIYLAAEFNADTYYSQYRITVEANYQYVIQFIPGSFNDAAIIKSNYSPSYASSRLHPYTVDNRLFFREESRPFEYSGHHIISEYDFINEVKAYSFRATEPYDFSKNCSAIAGVNYYYQSNRTTDFLAGTRGGEFRRITIDPLAFEDGELLTSRGSPEGCFGNLHSDNGHLYDVVYDSGNSSVQYYERDLITGLPEHIAGLSLETDHASLYHEFEYKMMVHNGIGYMARRRIADGGIEIWKTDFVAEPVLIFDEVPDQAMAIHMMDIDDGYIALADNDRILVYNINTNSSNMYDSDLGGSIYNMQILYINQ